MLASKILSTFNLRLVNIISAIFPTVSIMVTAVGRPDRSSLVHNFSYQNFSGYLLSMAIKEKLTEAVSSQWPIDQSSTFPLIKGERKRTIERIKERTDIRKKDVFLQHNAGLVDLILVIVHI